MKVYTDAPIYNYASGEDDYSNFKSAKLKKTTDKIKKGLESDYGKAAIGALAGVASQKIQNWAGTGTAGGQTFTSPIGIEPLPEVSANQQVQDKEKKGMSIWAKVGIGVGIVAVLGITTVLILRSKKGK